MTGTNHSKQADAIPALDVPAGSASSLLKLIHARGCTPMGEYRCQVPMPIGGRLCGIDYCIADIVAALNAANIRTVMSCCGHGDESIARIDLADGRAILVRGHSPNVAGQPRDTTP